MKYSNLTNFGFGICTFAFMLGVLGNKEIATHIFILGFYVSVLGFAFSTFERSREESGISVGQKVAMAGFIFATLAILPAFYFDNEQLSNRILSIGGVVMVFDIFKHLTQIREK